MMAAAGLQPLPSDVRCVADYEAHARAALDQDAWRYFSAQAGDGVTARANRCAWDEWALLPRVLRGVREVDTRVDLLGTTLPWPVLVAPMALQRWAHDEGERATAVAASALGASMVLASQASVTIESAAAAFAPGPGRGAFWLQLYLLKDRGATLELVRRAEQAGCQALVLTVDAAVRAGRALRLPPGLTTVNLPDEAPGPVSLAGWLAQAPTWDDVAWLCGQTRLPVLLKGVLHPADAREAAHQGVAGIVVSNHGGRVLDGAAATATALPAIVDAAGDALPVLVDGGLQRGTDILKALALGARAVLLGRPVLWGLAAAGAAGAAHVLRLLRDELELAMAQCGAGSIAQLDRGLLLRSRD